MTSVVCTLFEGNYHYGLAALTNSLLINGFKGSIFAGFRGNLPEWATSNKGDYAGVWTGSTSLEIAPDIKLHFIPLTTDYHLTNYKPDFLLEVWDKLVPAADAMYYFDPDIVVSAEWFAFGDWVKCGVALCEDINSPLEENHPRRVAWREYYGEKNIKLTFKSTTYINGGFVGLSKYNKHFLHIWKNLQEAMAPVIGGLNRSSLAGAEFPEKMRGPFAAFNKTDQDALNAAVEAFTGSVSIVGKEAMAFKGGYPIMPHALGQPKPWNWNPLLQAFSGRPPRTVDRHYWQHVNSAIVTHPASTVRFRKASLVLAGFIGRFYSKN
ncbi:hypothetical protein [Adhaeribacter aquaticus]|uniref:hypothetical protein n=1 Tax=Adhaeribacter aquaticus TaxID=299567 RepID=UPI000407583B|nr:hypothetical protein [Adhaeribacter aquaticus]